MLAVYRKKVLSRRTFTSSSFFNLSRWCESVEFGMSSSDWISPTTKPSGCADSSNCMIRRRGSVPMAESMSAYFATCSVFFLLVAIGIFRYLQKYKFLSTRISHEARQTRLKKLLLDSSKYLSDCAHPQRRIICGAVVIRSADILISPTKGRHNGNSWQGLSEMSGKVTSFFPRGAVPDQNDTY